MKLNNDMILGQSVEDWKRDYPLLHKIMVKEPVFWTNPSLVPFDQVKAELSLSRNDIRDALDRWKRFAPYVEKVFPETKQTNGIIESELKNIVNMRTLIQSSYSEFLDGELFLKMDNELPIAGSIKARGGIYEVLKHAEMLALEHGLIVGNENYAIFADEAFKQLFSQYSVAVGSTGNLGLSIGIISAKLGFNVNVHMSSDAKQWKKDLLTSKGANVVEYDEDFSVAVDKGREQSTQDLNSYFVDDESSRDLFLGYSVAALRLKEQLTGKNITVDNEHPLFVYLPCGVGGSPGGINFGLKHAFGDAVHCFFVEPTHSPSVLLGLMTGKHDKVRVQDFGIDNKTEADGLAVGTPSTFATKIVKNLVSGIYTIEDHELFKLLALLVDSEQIALEPSAASSLLGPIELTRNSDYIEKNHLTDVMKNATHISWATGGDLVPKTDMETFYEKGKSLLKGRG